MEPFARSTMSTSQLLRYAGELARALNAKRVELGVDNLAQKFVTADHSEFYLRVTSHMAQWIVPYWLDHSAFDQAQVSYLRSMTPREHALVAK